jgi:hypothetical protein
MFCRIKSPIKQVININTEAHAIRRGVLYERNRLEKNENEKMIPANMMPE